MRFIKEYFKKDLSAAALIDKAGLANEVLFIIFLDVSYWDLQKTTPTNTTPSQPILPKTVPNRYSTTTRRLPRRKREKEKEKKKKDGSSTIHVGDCIKIHSTSLVHQLPMLHHQSPLVHQLFMLHHQPQLVHQLFMLSSTIHAAPSTATSSSTIHATSSTTTTPTIHASPSTTYISSTTHAASSGSPTTHAAP
ncbi:hypothetical protein ACTFIR_011802 [Dictyostelium discoideum]